MSSADSRESQEATRPMSHTNLRAAFISQAHYAPSILAFFFFFFPSLCCSPAREASTGNSRRSQQQEQQPSPIYSPTLSIIIFPHALPALPISPSTATIIAILDFSSSFFLRQFPPAFAILPQKRQGRG